MIGVSANEADLEIAREFFELFKTPWEPVVPSRKYRAVLCTDGRTANLDADLILIYSSRQEPYVRESSIEAEQLHGPQDLTWGEWTFPIYGRVARLGGSDAPLVECRGQGIDCRQSIGPRVVRRIGYDLFEETRHLLTHGQPALRAGTPTLELHIGLLRHLLVESDVSFVEIPPRPSERDFICCLTHDVDFFGIRRHRFDRTLWGFAARASVGTLSDVLRGRRALREAFRNWAALLSLPLVFLGLVRDFWRPFDDYSQVESGRPSTFFLVPFKGRPGTGPDGAINARRATPYGIPDVALEAAKAADEGSEIALHGIDAWRDASAGREELAQMGSLSRRPAVGVRMHWLYFAPDSPRQLEAAGFDYDSTWGYNDAVGYRAGTSQVFQLAGTSLLELPLSIMDSALLFPDRMGLSQENAFEMCRQIVANARRLGGTVVVNWHDRSLAPERLWNRCYSQLLMEIEQGDRVWFAMAGEAVDWFRWRRGVRFVADASPGRLNVIPPSTPQAGPAAAIRIHRGGGVTEVPFDGSDVVTVEL